MKRSGRLEGVPRRPGRFAFAWPLMRFLFSLLVVVSFATGCAKLRYALSGTCPEYDFGTPPGVSPPAQPPEVCMTPERVALGRSLFYDRRLSLNETQSCSTCHVAALGFADGKARPTGSTGQIHPRNVPGLADVGYFSVLTWTLPELTRLENQTLIPFFSEKSDVTIEELNVSGKEYVILDRLKADQNIRAMFEQAFPGEPIDISHIAKALAVFQTTLISYQSPFDLGHMNDAAKRGYALFQSEKTGCFHCHGGRDFNQDDQAGKLWYQNVGLYNVSDAGDYPDHSLHGSAGARQTQGLSLVTGKKEDRGKFRTPSLRNVSVTAPYMHDGSVATLEEAIEVFANGGRNIANGPFAGDGTKNPNKDVRVRALSLSRQDKADLVEFLKALKDECFLSNPNFSDPGAPPPLQPEYCK